MTNPTTPGIDITPAAAAILNQERNAYWRPTAPDTLVDAVEFAEPSFLAGPFNERFGLVYVAYSPDAPPLQEMLDDVQAKVMDAQSTTYLPYSARNRINAMYPNGVEFLWDAETQTAYSELDRPFLSEEVRARLKGGERSAPFSNTVEGKKILFGSLTADERAHHQRELEKAVTRIHEEMRIVQRCAEYPYSVRLQGNDDASWTVAAKDMMSAQLVITALRQKGYAAVQDLMYFTN